MKKYLLLVAMLMFAAPAFATYCGSNTDHPGAGAPYYPNNCNDPPTTQPPQPPSNHNANHNTNSNTQGQGQAQGQHQGQTATGGTGVGIGVGQGGAGGSATGGSVGNTTSTSQGGSSRSNATGGTSSATGGTSSSGGNTLSNGSASTSNGIVNVDTSDHSQVSNRSNVFIPGDLPGNAMTIAPGAYITVAGDADCGVLQAKVEIPVYQWNKRGTKKIQVGVDEDLAPVFDSNGVQIDYQTVYTGNGGYYLRGSHVTYVLSTQGSSNSSQLGLQGGGGGGYGGVSYGSGRSYSQAGARLIIRSCIASRVAPAPVQTPRQARRPTARRKAAVRRPAPVACVPRAARVCPAR